MLHQLYELVGMECRRAWEQGEQGESGYLLAALTAAIKHFEDIPRQRWEARGEVSDHGG